MYLLTVKWYFVAEFSFYHSDIFFCPELYIIYYHYQMVCLFLHFYSDNDFLLNRRNVKEVIIDIVLKQVICQ